MPRTEQAQQRIQSRASERADQQLQRRTIELGRRLGQRRTDELRRVTEAATNRRDENRRDNASIRGMDARQRGLDKAIQHVDLHSAIAEGRVTGAPIRLTAEQRQVVNEVFGDSSALDSERSSEPEPPEARGKLMRPGSKANPRARLANAIRVRQTKISELRDLAIETNDESLLKKADFFEEKLQTFLENQARVEASLAKSATRSRNLDAEPIADDSLIEEDTIVRTAESESEVSVETRVE